MCINNGNGHAIQSTSDKSATGQDSKSESVKAHLDSIKTALLEKEAFKCQDNQSEKMIMISKKMIMIHRIASEDTLNQTNNLYLIFYIK